LEEGASAPFSFVAARSSPPDANHLELATAAPRLDCDLNWRHLTHRSGGCATRRADRRAFRCRTPDREIGCNWVQVANCC